jgi:hypothetical protein
LYVCAVNIYIYMLHTNNIYTHIYIHIHMPWMNDLRCFVNCCTDTNSNRFSLTAAWCNSMRERLATRHTSWSSRGVSAATLLPVWLLIFVRLASCTPSRVYESQGGSGMSSLPCIYGVESNRVDREKCSYAMISHSISGAKEQKWIRESWHPVFIITDNDSTVELCFPLVLATLEASQSSTKLLL